MFLNKKFTSKVFNDIIKLYDNIDNTHKDIKEFFLKYIDEIKRWNKKMKIKRWYFLKNTFKEYF